MTIKLLCIGKTNINFVDDGLNHYLNRLKHYCKFEIEEIPDVKNGNKMKPHDLKIAEGQEILKKLRPAEIVALLDENGTHYTSVEFSEWLNKTLAAGGKGLVIIIGGAYGFSDDVCSKVHARLSLSKLTFNHQMVRLIAAEQIYRAFTILKGEPYHHA